MRGYIFAAPTPTSGPNNASTTSFGILPPPAQSLSSATGNNWYAAGGGLEQIFAKHLGAGLDLAAIVPGQGKVFPNALGVVSPNFYAHLSPTGNSDVYATVGYSLVFRTFTANGINFGAGWNYWFHENLGLLLEVRTIWLPSPQYPNPPDNHYTQIRFGLTFR